MNSAVKRARSPTTRKVWGHPGGTTTCSPGEAELIGGGPAERFRCHRALRALVELLGRERPLALVLDDLHWADEASVEFVLHLLRRTPRVPHLLPFALRPVDPVARLRAVRGWTELTPLPLTPDGSNALLPAQLSPALRRQMAHEAAGNPLFLHELGRLGAGATGPLPQPVRHRPCNTGAPTSTPHRPRDAGAASIAGVRPGGRAKVRRPCTVRAATTSFVSPSRRSRGCPATGRRRRGGSGS